MKIGKYEITGGPNLEWYLVTVFFLWAAATHCWWIFVGWIVFSVVIIPLSIYAHKRNNEAQERHERMMNIKYPGWKHWRRGE